MPRHQTLVRPLLDWFARHARDLPWRRTRDPYAIWISEVMLQQTQVASVLPYWERWMKEFPRVETLAAAPLDRVLKLWEGLGYYTRARNLHRAAQEITTAPGGRFPQDLDALLALPGVGRYTAGAICSIAFNQPAPILDGNVIRVLTRLFAIPENAREKAALAKLWELAEHLVRAAAQAGPPEEFNCSRLNQALMELGATLCTPRQPACDRCPVARRCAARKQGRPEDFPVLPPRPAPVEREFHAFVLQAGDRFLVQRRPSGGVNARLWEFPNIETTGTGWNAATALHRCLGSFSASPAPLCILKHSITRSRITLRAFLLRASREEAARFPRAAWQPFEALEALAFPSAHRRVARKLASNGGPA